MKFAYNCHPDHTVCHVARIGENGLLRRHGRFFQWTEKLNTPKGLDAVFKQVTGAATVVTPILIFYPAHNVCEVSEEIASAAYYRRPEELTEFE